MAAPLARRLLATLAVLALPLVPAAGAAEAREREGTVAILPAVRFPKGADAPAPGLTLSFGLKPSRTLEVGIDVSASRSGGTDGGYLVAVPVGVSFEWTPLPALDVRPVIHATLGKAFVAVDGEGGYGEATPYFALAGAGITADLSSELGLYADGGYLVAGSGEGLPGSPEIGGPLVRLGIYFRWDPIPERL